MTEDVPQYTPHNPRVLFFTKDTTITNENSDSFKRTQALCAYFQEVHVIIINEDVDEEKQILRPLKNLWFYETQSSSWWRMAYDAYRLAEGQMVFGEGFRADLVIADDPYESGLAGWFLSKKYEVPFQLHIHGDFYDEEFTKETEHPAFYNWSAQYLINKVSSARTRTEFQKQAVIEENKKLEGKVEVLPNYLNLSGWRDTEPEFDLKEKYPQHNFLMLHISLMKKTSGSIEALHGAAKILHQYPSIGLVMVGNGPVRHQLEKQVVQLGLQKQVHFEPMPEDIISHLKTASVLIHLSEDSEEDTTLLAAATAKLPIVAFQTGLAGELFVDDESAQLCESTDLDCVSEAINRYLNENRERSSFAIRAREIVFDKIVQDYDTYIKAYRDSIVGCLTNKETETAD